MTLEWINFQEFKKLRGRWVHKHMHKHAFAITLKNKLKAKTIFSSGLLKSITKWQVLSHSLVMTCKVLHKDCFVKAHFNTWNMLCYSKSTIVKNCFFILFLSIDTFWFCISICEMNIVPPFSKWDWIWVFL